MYSRILVPLDGSMDAEEVLPHVQQLARCLGAAVILVRNVTPAALTKVQEIPYQILQQQDANRQCQEAGLYLKGMQGEFRAQGIETRTSIVAGPPVKAIVTAARREAADLIAIATRPTLLGSNMAIRLARYADCPVLVIRSQRRK